MAIALSYPIGYNSLVSNPTPSLKPLEWTASSKKDLMTFPAEVQQVVGFALHIAQTGERSTNTRILQGFGGASVLEVRDNFSGDTYRAVYTVRFARAIYVLHCFQKKSHQGIATDPQDIALISARLGTAQEHYRKNYFS